MRTILVVLWFVFWPASEVCGRPVEANEDVGWRRLLKLFGVAMTITAIVAAIVILTD